MNRLGHAERGEQNFACAPPVKQEMATMLSSQGTTLVTSRTDPARTHGYIAHRLNFAARAFAPQRICERSDENDERPGAKAAV